MFLLKSHREEMALATNFAFEGLMVTGTGQSVPALGGRIRAREPSASRLRPSISGLDAARSPRL